MDAGPDQTITLPDSAVLDGTVSDDDLPTPPGAVTTTWSMVSGPLPVTFGDSSAVDTTASFSVGGTYELKLEANDGDLITYDTLIITVQPENQAPYVFVGSDQIITLPDDANLNGTVTDDGYPTPPVITTTWSMESGPGTVTFGDASAVDTTASFSVVGTYVLKLEADDGLLTNDDTLTVIVEPVFILYFPIVMKSQ